MKDVWLIASRASSCAVVGGLVYAIGCTGAPTQDSKVVAKTSVGTRATTEPTTQPGCGFIGEESSHVCGGSCAKEGEQCVYFDGALNTPAHCECTAEPCKDFGPLGNGEALCGGICPPGQACEQDSFGISCGCHRIPEY